MEKTTESELRGRVERVSYANPDNGWTVAQVKPDGRRDLVTVVGPLMAPTPGETLAMRGWWTRHPRFGEQFRVRSFRSEIPATVEGIRKYLGSGLVKGIGPRIAGRIVDVFGEQTLDVIDGRIQDMAQVPGIGKKRIAMIRNAWAEQKEIREVMLFLQSHGVGPGYAARIFKQYGREAIVRVRENPYRLATDIYGIGFLTADRIAAALGFEKHAPLRVEAGILHVLNRLAEQGHVYYPESGLMEKAGEILDVDRPVVETALAAAAEQRRVILETMADDREAPADDRETPADDRETPADDREALMDDREAPVEDRAVYLAPFYHCEVSVANRLRIIAQAPADRRAVDPERALAWARERLAIRLTADQAGAVKRALMEKALVITGGPGTGKTTLINAILMVFDTIGVRILLAAPTGRAAKRMTETTGREARTIHRLLAFAPAHNAFQKNFDDPLECDLLVVDEASMIDTVLMHHLLQAVPATATLVLVGDVNQLPSVGPGNVLRDIIDSGAVPVVALTEIFRQARESRIVVNAHRINAGAMPECGNGQGSDFYFIEKEDPEAVRNIILELARERIPRRFGFDPMTEIQVITPMHRGVVGAGHLNEALQEALNPGPDAVVRGRRRYRVGDRVMQSRNDYDRQVFNGDIGHILHVDPVDQTVIIAFDGRQVAYDFNDLDALSLAYAVSVHKSQGSEYPAVVMPVMVQHYLLLQRNLIYTAVTRGRRLVVLVGTRKALAIAVKNDRAQRRHTRLRERLRGGPMP